jgi:hypothetical protein
VQAKAKERLAALVDPAIDTLRQLLTQKKSRAVALGAVNSVLDRNGFRPKDHVEHSGGISVRWAMDDEDTNT